MKPVDFETAKLAKEKGYNGKSHYWFNPHGTLISKLICTDEENDHTASIIDIENVQIYDTYHSYPAPYLFDLKDWLEKTHKMYVEPTILCVGELDIVQFKYVILHHWKVGNHLKEMGKEYYFDSYREALAAGLLKALTFI